MKKVVATFEEMIQNYYGGSPTIELRPIDRYEAVIANYYGKPFQKKKCKKPPVDAPAAVAMSADDGELLPQPAAKDSGVEEYVVQRSLGEPVFGDYIVDRGGDSNAAPAIGRTGLSDSASAAAERQVDMFQSQQEDAAPKCCAANGAAPSPCPPSPDPRAVSRSQPTVAQSLSSPTQKPPVPASEEDFAADLQAILSGQQVYDPRAKKVVPREQLSQQSSNGGESPRPSPDPPNPHEIFDQIAERMKYANTFDLGTVELQKRFGEFDALRDLEAKDKVKDKNKKKDKTIAPAQAASESVIKPDTGDFIHDLDAIRNQHSAASDSMDVAASLDPSQYSKPLFDTGEHVLLGPDLYDGLLRVGKDPGVGFSYAQIIAMADLYGSVDEMMSADASNLQQVKALIERSTEYYRGGAQNKKLNPSNKQWNDATGGRFLDLAEDNYEHFSPNFFFPNASFAGSVHQHGTNKSQWEAYHKRAILEAQRALQANPNASPFLGYPLIINAFGDHFLTDAFAAGHVINKEEMIAYFRSNFFNGTSLKPEAKKFFKKLGDEAFRGEVAKQFSALETADLNPKVCVRGWCLGWHSRINSANRFGDLLTKAAEQQPDAVANFAVKALHDKLNETGIEVVNDAGDGLWTIKGDLYLHLNEKSATIIRKAVQQSVENITSFNDPVIAPGNINFPMYFAHVWKYLPRLTDASKRYVVEQANVYLVPTSDRLVKAAAEIITNDLPLLIHKLVEDEHKLRPA